MLNFFAKRRFNYIDVMTMSLASGFFSQGHWSQGIAVMIVGFLFSLKCEDWSAK